jgi:post-segregation antitoxin (ccd killing protein)
MTVDELKALLNVTTDKELAERFKRSKGQISKWRSNGIPQQVMNVIDAILVKQKNLLNQKIVGI